MPIQDIDNALGIIQGLLHQGSSTYKREDLVNLEHILSTNKERVDQTITFDSFAGAITDNDCSGYLQELEDCLNEVHQQISEELDRSSSSVNHGNHDIVNNSSEVLYVEEKHKLSRLSDDEGIGLPENLQPKEAETRSLITHGTYQPTGEEENLIAQARHQYSAQLKDNNRTYIEGLEKELLVCKTRERDLDLDRTDLVEKMRAIHGILEDKQRQWNRYIEEWEEKSIKSRDQYEDVLRERNELLLERDSLVLERDNMSIERDNCIAERDSMATERDNMESDKWDIMKQLREVEKRCECLQEEVKFRDDSIKSLQEENERFSQECMCVSLDSLQSRPMSRSSSLRSKSSVGSKGSGLSRLLTLRHRHQDSDTDSFGDEEALATNPKKRSRPRLQFPLFSEDTEREKRKILGSIKEVPMVRWKSDAVVAWLELVVKMPMYSKACSENVKSGKVLLSLSDNDIQTGFQMTNPLHKRKLRLALEDARAPESITYPAAARLDNQWVIEEWLPSLGLNQYKGTFRENLVDGRVLNSLTKKDIERNLNVVDKSHQTSLMLGIELLAKYSFDKDHLEEKRSSCQNIDTDVEVWSTGRCAQWLISVDLKEYANKLSYSGIHGAVIVHDKEFNVDVLAAALGIPVQRKVLRRHMEQEIVVLKSGGSKRTTALKPKSGRLKDQISRAFNKQSDCEQVKLKAFKAASGHKVDTDSFTEMYS